MGFLYSAAIALLQFMLPLGALFDRKAATFLKVRSNWEDAVRKVKKHCGEDPILWFHCASLGEFEMAVPVLAALRHKGKYKLVVSFFSPSGYEKRSQHELLDGAFYLPVDTRRNMKKLVSMLDPSALFLVKYDFWYGLIYELNCRQKPVYLLNGLLRTDHYLLKPWAGWFRKQLGSFRHVFAQNKESADLFRKIGLTRVKVTGDLRFDRVGKEKLEVLDRVEQFKGNRFLIVAGSSWPEEEDLLCAYLKISTRDVKIVLVPHDVSLLHIKRIEEQFSQFGVVKWSVQTEANTARVLIVDQVGLLKKVYLSADMVFIGGGFSGNVHNVLEAAVVGMPVLCGPKSKKFPEIQEMEAEGFLHRVIAAEDIQHYVAHYTGDAASFDNASHRCREYVVRNQGAVDQVMEELGNETT